MLRPSYSELMDLLNDDRDLDSQITSRYTIVIAAAKRARQIVAGAVYEPDPTHKTDKAVSHAVSELGRGIIKLYPDGLPNSIMDAKRELDRQRDPRYYDRNNYKTEKSDAELFIEIDDDEPLIFEPNDEIDDEIDDDAFDSDSFDEEIEAEEKIEEPAE
jgi:DNA-directed RNA polymerase subunit omega